MADLAVRRSDTVLVAVTSSERPDCRTCDPILIHVLSPAAHGAKTSADPSGQAAEPASVALRLSNLAARR